MSESEKELPILYRLRRADDLAVDAEAVEGPRKEALLKVLAALFAVSPSDIPVPAFPSFEGLPKVNKELENYLNALALSRDRTDAIEVGQRIFPDGRVRRFAEEYDKSVSEETQVGVLHSIRMREKIESTRFESWAERACDILAICNRLEGESADPGKYEQRLRPLLLGLVRNITYTLRNALDMMERALKLGYPNDVAMIWKWISEIERTVRELDKNLHAK